MIDMNQQTIYHMMFLSGISIEIQNLSKQT